VDRHRAYILAIDPIIEPDTVYVKPGWHQHGFIPGWLLIKMLILAKERESQKTETFKTRALRWVNLGIFGEVA